MVALPGVYLTPLADRTSGWVWVLAELVVDGRWVECRVMRDLVGVLLEDWEQDPEGALVTWWGREPPVGRQREAEGEDEPEAIRTNIKAEDLGL